MRHRSVEPGRVILTGVEGESDRAFAVTRHDPETRFAGWPPPGRWIWGSMFSTSLITHFAEARPAQLRADRLPGPPAKQRSKRLGSSTNTDSVLR